MRSAAWLASAATTLSALLLAGCGGADRRRALPLPPRTREGTEFLVWLSDVHADPDYGLPNSTLLCTTRPASPAVLAESPLGYMGCDPPLGLFEETVQAAQSIHGVDVALFTGDFVRHDAERMLAPWESVAGVIDDGAKLLAKGFPDLARESRVSVGTLGNNDSPKNYGINLTELQARNPWIGRVADVFQRDSVMDSSVAGAYWYGGFFESRTRGLTLLTINTLLYSVFHVPESKPLPADPFGQLDWLRWRLEEARARNTTAWIIGHIPPGIETYGYSELWHPTYLQSYLDIVQDPNLTSTVAAQLFGHTHTDEFRLLAQPSPGAGPILVTGAISPIYHNNPNFRVVEFDPATGRPVSYSVYYAQLQKGAERLSWSLGYTATERYRALAAAVERDGHLTEAAFRELAEEFQREPAVWDEYTQWYKATYPNDLQGDACTANSTARSRCVATYSCAAACVNQSAFDACAGFSKRAIGPVATPLALPEHRRYQALRDEHWRSLRRAGWTPPPAAVHV